MSRQSRSKARHSAQPAAEARHFGLAFWATVVSGVIATVAGGVVLAALTGALPTSKASPAGVRGDGTEHLTGQGGVGGRPFRPQTAFVYPTERGIELYIYERTYTCSSAATWSRSGSGARFEVSLTEDPAAVSTIPVGRRLEGVTAGYSLYGPANSMTGSGVRATNAVVTRLSTDPDTTWRGTVSVSGFQYRLQHYWFRGAFEARWCGL
jgi:hypothetical protein